MKLVSDLTWSRRLIVLALPCAALLSNLVQGETVAYFRGTAAGTPNQMAAGKIDLVAGPPALTMTLTDMMPGESLVSPLTVQNSGSLPMRYTLFTTATNADGKGLAGQLKLTVKRGVSSCTAAGFDASGSTVYGADGPLATIGSPTNLIGTPTSYPNGGVVLTEGATDSLCLRVRMPSTIGTSYQAAEAATTFTASAQQS